MRIPATDTVGISEISPESNSPLRSVDFRARNEFSIGWIRQYRVVLGLEVVAFHFPPHRPSFYFLPFYRRAGDATYFRILDAPVYRYLFRVRLPPPPSLAAAFLAANSIQTNSTLTQTETLLKAFAQFLFYPSRFVEIAALGAYGSECAPLRLGFFSLRLADFYRAGVLSI